MTAQQKLDLAKAELQAEFDGVVVSRGELDKGSAVTEGMELLTIANCSDLSVKIKVLKSNYGDVREGQKADIRIGNHTYTGTVESAIIAVMGGGIGILAGTILSAIICAAIHMKLVISPLVMLSAAGVSMGIGMFFGIYPDSKAAHLSPMECLRHE